MIDEDDRGDWEHDVAKDKELDRKWEEIANEQLRRTSNGISIARPGRRAPQGVVETPSLDEEVSAENSETRRQAPSARGE